MKTLLNQFVPVACLVNALVLVCAPVAAWGQTGACCLGNGSCIVTNATGCATVSGEFLGAGTACSPGACEGACCLPGGDCSVGSMDACSSAGGDFQGAGSTCAAHCPGQLGSGFTYQGRLKLNGEDVAEPFDLQATLWTAAIGGSQIGPQLTITAVAPSDDGTFTIQLDFGEAGAAFDGDARWLQIAVRQPAGPSSFTTLNPRQSVTGAPYALHSVRTRGIFVDGNDNVGIGTASPTARLDVEDTSAGAVVIRGRANAGNGVLGLATGNSGVGVVGHASAISGGGIGGHFESNAFTGRAVNAVGTGTGGSYGVYAEVTSGTFAAVYGLSSGTSGAGYGVFGETAGDSGRAVFGLASSNTGNTYGVQGHVNSPTGYAAHFTGGRNYFQNNVGIGHPNPSHPLHMLSGAHCTVGGAWTNSSSRELKDNFEEVDPRRILDGVLDLPVRTWNYISEGEEVRHLGPTAEDFASLFRLGADDGAITTVDITGVALASIQGVHQIVREKEAAIEALLREKDAEITALRARLDFLERVVDRLARQQDEDIDK